MKDTREQSLTNIIDRHLAVTANAGSGKTRTLVNRYVRLALSGIDPYEIVAITFTRKAASEMLSKVITSIEKIRARANEPSEMKKLLKIREKLTTARIMTIHSFCSSILRDYPAEAGLSPFFIELGNAELYRIREESIAGVLEERLGDKSRAEGVKSLLLRLGIDTTRQYINKLIDRVEIFDELRKLYLENEPEDYLLRRNDLFEKYVVVPLRLAISDAEDYLKSIDLSKLSEKQVHYYNNGMNTVCKINRACCEFKCDYDYDFRYLFESTSEFLESGILTQSFSYRKEISKKSSLNEEELFNKTRYFGVFNILEALKAIIENGDIELELFSLSRILIDISQEVMEEIEIEKQILGGIDFNDMLLKTNRLLDDENIRAQVRRKIRYLLIDEFQDTNKVQYEIIKKLIPSLSGKHFKEEPLNLYIVGDSKQSIYGFRYADIRVYERVIRDITNINRLRIKTGSIEGQSVEIDERKFELSNEEAEGKIVLSASFRLYPAVAAFVNKVCSHVMSKGKSEFDVRYEPLVCTKSNILQKDADGQYLIPGGQRDRIGSVSILLGNTNSKESNLDEEEINNSESKNQVSVEADLLAKYILKQIKGDEPIPVEEQNVRRNADWKDIAILSRTSKHFDLLAERFRYYGIPYIIHSGGGFFKTAEIMDMISLMKFLHNRNNDSAFAGLLKSYFIGFDDLMLYRISRANITGSLWNKFIAFAESTHLNAMDSKHKHIISDALDLLLKTIGIAGRIPISQLLLNFLEESKWHGVVSGSRAFEQILSNIYKFISIARDFEKRGFRNINDFVNELKSIERASAKETEAAFVSGANAVNIMTIHSAKGLEFPIVAIFRAGFYQSQNDESFASEELGLTYSLPVRQEDYTGKVDTISHILNKHRVKIAEDAEEMRLFYVALTRAKEHLILTGGNPRSTGYFFNYIKKAFDNANIFKDNSTGIITFGSELEFLTDSGLVNTKFDYEIQVIEQLTIENSNQDKKGSIIISKNGLFGDMPLFSSEDFISATKLYMFRNDKDEFMNRYRLGLPSSTQMIDSFPRDEVESEKDKLRGSFFGTIVHQVLEKIKLWFVNGKVDEVSLIEVIENICLGYERIIADEIKEEIMGHCINISKTKLLLEYADRISDSKTEYGLYVPLGNDFLSGVIDVVIKDGGGNIEIWDWKTNTFRNLEELDTIYLNYETQMKIYAYLLMLTFPNQDTYQAKLLFTRAAKADANDSDWIRGFVWTKDELFSFEEELVQDSKNIKNELFLMSSEY